MRKRTFYHTEVEELKSQYLGCGVCLRNSKWFGAHGVESMWRGATGKELGVRSLKPRSARLRSSTFILTSVVMHARHLSTGCCDQNCRFNTVHLISHLSCLDNRYFSTKWKNWINQATDPTVKKSLRNETQIFSVSPTCLPTRITQSTSKKKKKLEFPGGPVVRTLRFHAKGLGSIPGQGTKIHQDMRRGQKRKKMEISGPPSGSSAWLAICLASSPGDFYDQASLGNNSLIEPREDNRPGCIRIQHLHPCIHSFISKAKAFTEYLAFWAPC